MNTCSPAVWIGIGILLVGLAVLSGTNIAMFRLYDKTKRDLDIERYINEKLNVVLKNREVTK
jgi:hypothetical protein